MLYSAEFLEAARQRLAPGGIFVQWYHQYESDQPSLELVLRTYASVFDDLAVWYGVGPDLFLLGFNDPGAATNLDRLLRRMERPDFRAGLARCGIDEPVQLLAHEVWPLGVLQALELRGPLHTLTHPRLADRAARAFFAGGAAMLPFSGGGEALRRGVAGSLLGRYLARQPAGEQVALKKALAEESCRHRKGACVLWLADWELAAPYSVEPRVLLRNADPPFGGSLPPELVDDAKVLLSNEPLAPGATWSPGRLGRLTNVWQMIFQAARPEPNARLLAMWERCEQPNDPAACEAGRRRASALLAGNAARSVR
jgi:hypothetical protein